MRVSFLVRVTADTRASLGRWCPGEPTIGWEALGLRGQGFPCTPEEPDLRTALLLSGRH